MSKYKTCTKCKEYLPVTKEYFYCSKRKDKIYFQSRCKECFKKISKEKYEDMKFLNSLINRDIKECNMCKKSYPKNKKFFYIVRYNKKKPYFKKTCRLCDMNKKYINNIDEGIEILLKRIENLKLLKENQQDDEYNL